ncbi:hypothetical protein [Streptomyces sp. NPDC019890]|uniref:hypothetical protein n=1 Tax=Streptomyces sp. NPDC019890 TaxID=3365064 RepID=UPI0038506EF8
MARVIVVHGVGQQLLGRRTLQHPVAAALLDGVELTEPSLALSEPDVGVAFYGHIFRKAGTKGTEAPRSAADIADAFEAELVEQWWRAAVEAEPDRVAEAARAGGKAPTPVTVQHMINALLRSRCLSTATAERFLLGVLRQVRRYFTEEDVRAAAVTAVADRVSADTRVLVGHSLGSVVAYEALCAHPHWPVRTLVTLGSPLGMPRLIFNRLLPTPTAGRGIWPPGVAAWSNINDRHDVVASVKQLGPLFDSPGRAVTDLTVDNGWKVHDLLHHLTAQQVGRAIADALKTTP